MDRIQLLRALIAEKFDGNQAAFGRAIKRPPSLVNQWLSGHRAFGDASARHVEIALFLGQGYFDHRTTAADRSDSAASKNAILSRRFMTVMSDGRLSPQSRQAIEALIQAAEMFPTPVPDCEVEKTIHAPPKTRLSLVSDEDAEPV